MQRCRMKALAIGLACASLAAGNAMAEEADACGRFAWPLTVERERVLAPEKPAFEIGTELPAGLDRAFSIKLQPTPQVTFVRPPERMRSEGYGGFVTMKSLAGAGLYQVTMSEDAWLDVIQNGEFARSAGASGRRNCPGLRKTVRFHLQAAPIVIQVSAVDTRDIVIVVRKVD